MYLVTDKAGGFVDEVDACILSRESRALLQNLLGRQLSTTYVEADDGGAGRAARGRGSVASRPRFPSTART